LITLLCQSKGKNDAELHLAGLNEGAATKLYAIPLDALSLDGQEKAHIRQTKGSPGPVLKVIVRSANMPNLLFDL
jgi:hypothetical protein